MPKLRSPQQGRDDYGELALDESGTEFIDPRIEREYRLFAATEDQAFLRRAMLVVTLIVFGCAAIDFAVTGLHRNWYLALTVRSAYLVFGLATLSVLRRSDEPEHVDRAAFAFVAGTIVAYGLVYAVIYSGPMELRDEPFLRVTELLLIGGIYVFLPNRFDAQYLLGWASLGIVVGVPWALAAPSPSFVVSQALFLAIANILGGLAASHHHRRRRLEYAAWRRNEELVERLRGEIEQRKTLEREKDRLLSIIAHDLRGPLSTVLGFAELLAEDAETLERSEIARYSRLSHDAGRRMLDLLRNLLDWGRLRMGRAPFAPAAQNLDELIERVLRVFTEAARLKSIELVPRVTAHGALGDVSMLESILRNLVSNAIKFTPSGGRVTVSAEERDGKVEIAVQDTGVGISPERREELLHDTTSSTPTAGTAGEPGSGLGLVLCRELVERHGGSLAIDDAPGGGTVFRFALPKAGAVPPAPPLPAAIDQP